MTQSCRASFWLIFACGGVRSRAPWRPWDDGGRHGRWLHGLASFYLGTMPVRCPPSTKSCQCGVFFIPYLNFGSENLELAFMDKSKGQKITEKEPLCSPKNNFRP